MPYNPNNPSSYNPSSYPYNRMRYATTPRPLPSPPEEVSRSRESRRVSPQVSPQVSPHSSHLNVSTDNLRDIVKKLQCDVKKLEFNLKLVDGENMSTKDFDKMKNNIISICGDDEDTLQFFKEMSVKKSVNFIKRVVTYLQMIAPICGIINLTAVPYITNYFKNIDEESKNNLLDKSFKNFSSLYNKLANIQNNIGLNDDVEMLDLIQNSAEVDMFDHPVATIQDGSLKNKLFAVVNSLSVKSVNTAKKILRPFQDNKAFGPKYNLLVEKSNKLWEVVCLSMWLYIILINLNNGKENPLTYMIPRGGNKRPPKKTQKK